MTDQDKPHRDPLQLLFIELRVGLARSAIQAGMILNGIAAVVVLAFLASLVRAPVGGALHAEAGQLKLAAGMFGLGVFVAAITFVNAYVAQGAIASGQQSAFGNGLRRLGLGLIVGSLVLFLIGLAISLCAIRTI
jgi:hypothetical protein